MLRPESHWSTITGWTSVSDAVRAIPLRGFAELSASVWVACVSDAQASLELTELRGRRFIHQPQHGG